MVKKDEFLRHTRTSSIPLPLVDHIQFIGDAAYTRVQLLLRGEARDAITRETRGRIAVSSGAVQNRAHLLIASVGSRHVFCGFRGTVFCL